MHPIYGSVWWLSHRKTTKWTVSRFGPQNLGAAGFRVWATKLVQGTISRFGPQNLGAGGFLSLGHKTQATDDKFPGFGLKTRGGPQKGRSTRGSVERLAWRRGYPRGRRGGRQGGTWRHPKACVEAKLRMRKARDRRIATLQSWTGIPLGLAASLLYPVVEGDYCIRL